MTITTNISKYTENYTRVESLDALEAVFGSETIPADELAQMRDNLVAAGLLNWVNDTVGGHLINLEDDDQTIYDAANGIMPAWQYVITTTIPGQDGYETLVCETVSGLDLDDPKFGLEQYVNDEYGDGAVLAFDEVDKDFYDAPAHLCAYYSCNSRVVSEVEVSYLPGDTGHDITSQM